jgi:hypothetical protein
VTTTARPRPPPQEQGEIAIAPCRPAEDRPIVIRPFDDCIAELLAANEPPAHVAQGPALVCRRAVGRTRILQAVALVAVVWIVPILAAVRADLPLVAAFHPVGAVFAFGLSLVVARGSVELLRDVDPGARTTRGEWILIAVVVVIVPFLSLSGSPEG